MKHIHKRYIKNDSMLNKNMIIQGDIEYSKKLVNLTKKYIKEDIDLYEAQDKIKNIIITENDEDYYNKYAGAINFVIENEYANNHRKASFIFHKGLYEHDIKHNTLYEDFEE